MAIPTTTYDIATATNPSSALTDFTFIVDLSTMSAAWWAEVDTSDGTKGRASKSDGTTELACDWIDFDSTAETGFLRVKWSGSLASTGTQVIRIYPPVAANVSVAAADTYGSNNAYDAGWEGYYPVYGDSSTTLSDRTSHGEDGTLTTGVSFSGDKLVFASSNSGVKLMSSKPLDGGSAFTIIVTANATNVDADRGLFYTDRHASGEPLLLWLDNAGTDHVAAWITAGSSTGGLYAGAVVAAETEYDIALTWSQANDVSRMYIDGIQDTTGSFPNTSTTAALNASDSANYTIGSSLKKFLGTMCNIQVHSVERSAAWVAEEYSQTSDNATFWGTWTWTAGTGGGGLPIPVAMAHYRRMR